MPTIFLSHAAKDKPFVHELASKLALFEVRCWVDEFEILPGDSLIAKIESGLDSADYVGAVLSPSSVNSEWVTRELRAALQGEISARKVKVLPILVKECLIPVFLRDKLYADFRHDFYHGLLSILRRLHGDDALSGATIERITAWAAFHHSVKPLEQFKSFVAREDHEKEQRLRKDALHARLAAMKYQDILDLFARSDAKNGVYEVADMIDCTEGCRGCGKGLLVIERLARRIAALPGWSKTSEEPEAFVKRRLGPTDLMAWSSIFGSGFVCHDCASIEQYKNQGGD